ncbi:MAG: nucleotidyltransferase domain-containing protein [Candidatus Jordarchaeales archaeon]|nr:nucleotidyltransferase domain-containing protein [Candidatus Jordarchaeia archaeon]
MQEDVGKRVVEVLRGKYKDLVVIFFGSRARGDHLNDNDYDLILVSIQVDVFLLKEQAKFKSFFGEKGIVGDFEILCYTLEEFEKKKKEHEHS